MAKLINSLFPKKEPIKIGHLTPLSGEFSYFGEWEKEGVDLAAEEINKKGGVNGQKVAVVRDDDRLDPALSKAVFERMIETEKVPAVIGSPSSDVVLAVAPVADKNQVVMLTAIAGSVKISTASNYLFRIYPTTVEEGEQLALIASQSGHKRAAIIYLNNSYGIELAKSVKRKTAEYGIDILAMEGYRKDNTDFSEQLGRIKEKDPEVIFLLGWPNDMSLILSQAREIGLNPKYFAPDTFEDPRMLKTAGRITEGVVYVAPEENLAPEFIKKFKKKYKKEPNIYNALCYDAFNLLVAAVKMGGNNGNAIRDELLKIKDYQGATGIITFNEHGDAVNRPLKVKTIKEGASIPYQK